jgi:glucan phosphoethanolaminetransferase (alkaline phosphatase superfamily)
MGLTNKDLKEKEDKEMVKEECFEIVASAEQKKFMYRKIDTGIILAFFSGAILTAGILFSLVLDRPVLGFIFIFASFISFYTARYLGLRMLFNEDDEEEEDDEDGR